MAVADVKEEQEETANKQVKKQVIENSIDLNKKGRSGVNFINIEPAQILHLYYASRLFEAQI